MTHTWCTEDCSLGNSTGRRLEGDIRLICWQNDSNYGQSACPMGKGEGLVISEGRKPPSGTTGTTYRGKPGLVGRAGLSTLGIRQALHSPGCPQLHTHLPIVAYGTLSACKPILPFSSKQTFHSKSLLSASSSKQPSQPPPHIPHLSPLFHITQQVLKKACTWGSRAGSDQATLHRGPVLGSPIRNWSLLLFLIPQAWANRKLAKCPPFLQVTTFNARPWPLPM